MPSRIQRIAFALAGLGWLALPSLAQQEQRAVPAPAPNPPAAAQAPDQLQGLNPDSFYGKDSTEGVYIRDSAGAVEKLALAAKMERLKAWGNSSDLYQEVLEKWRDRLVPSHTDKDGKIDQYTSIMVAVQDRLAKWPPEGLEVYRARFETAAEARLHAARASDTDTLEFVFSRFFVTDAGKQAGSRLIDQYLERGEFAAAGRVGTRLLEWHPNLGADAAGIQFRTAVAFHFAGEDARAMAALASLRKDHPNDRGTVRGRDVVLADALEHELKAPVTAPQGVGPDSWPLFAGNPSRSRVSTATGRPGAKLYSVPLSKPQWPSLPPQQKQMLDQQIAANTEQGMTVGVMPVADRGELFFNDGQRLYGVSLESGLPLPGWAQTYPGTGMYGLSNIWGSPRARQLTCTLTDHSVLAIMGQPDRQAMTVGVNVQGEAHLVCLDRQSGKESWNITMSQVPGDGIEAAIRSVQLSGSPLVVGDNVLVLGHANKQAQFEDCYVLSFDLTTGKFRWSCYIASASTAGAMWGMASPASGDPGSHLAYADGRVYVQTNLGALAAIDAYSGTIVWLSIYPSGNAPPNANGVFNPFMQGGVSQPATHKPWAGNPVIVAEEKIFTLPAEGKNLLIYDANNGRELKRIQLKHLDDGDTIVGVAGDRLIVAGEQSVRCLNWKTYDPDTFDDDKCLWIQSFPKEIRGRSFLTADSVFVPCKDRLYQLDLESALTKEVFPSYPRSWEETEGTGNVLVTSDHVIVAGAQSVDVYTDLTVARTKLDKEVAAAPADPEPRLRYAEVMFAAGNATLAESKLDEAINLIGGRSTMHPGAARDRVFNDALNFAQKLTGEQSDSARQKAAELFDRAGAAAQSPAQQVHFRLSRAKLEESQKDLPAAVRLYQEILSEASWRPVSLPDEMTGIPSQAHTVAEKQVARLMQDDPSVYQPYEQAAEKALLQAESAPARKAETLLEVAFTYPNSRSAAAALLGAADALETSGNSRGAIDVLRPMFFRYRDSAEAPRVMEALARNYLLDKPEKVGAAAAQLGLGAALPGDPKLQRPLKLPDGRELRDVTFSQALDEVHKYRDQQEARTLPDFGIPIPPSVEERAAGRKRPAPFLPASPQTVIADVKNLIMPLREGARSDRVAVWTASSTVAIYVAGQANPLAVSAAMEEEPTHLAWRGNNVMVWGAGKIIALSGDNARVLWTVELKDLEKIDISPAGAQPMAGGGGAAAMQPQIQVMGNNVRIHQQLVIQGNRRMFVRGGRGMPGIAAPPRPAPAPAAEQIDKVVPVSDRILLSTTSGRLISVDGATGRVAWQLRLTDRPFDRLVANDDFTVVKASDDAVVKLIALDSVTGELRGSRTFSVQEGAAPVNLALGSDGTLVYTLPDRLCLKNLYAPWPDSSDKEVTSPPGAMPFAGAALPDQLVIAEGRILALAQEPVNPALNKEPEKYVRVHSLETGQPVPLRYTSPQGNQEVDRILTAGKSWAATLRVVGSHLYVISPDGVIFYNLDRPAESVLCMLDEAEPPVIRDAFIGTRFLVLLDEQSAGNGANAANPAIASFRLHVFGRYPGSDTDPSESGRLDYVKDISDPSGIAPAWQAADGAFYYVTGDQKLHMLVGSAGPLKKGTQP